VLHLLARGEVILARALRRAAQARLPDPARQGAVGNLKIVLLDEQLLLPPARANASSSLASVCGLQGGAAPSRRMRRTLLRDSLSRRLISRRVRPCASRTRTLSRISTV
jgi:hypothetical protein